MTVAAAQSANPAQPSDRGPPPTPNAASASRMMAMNMSTFTALIFKDHLVVDIWTLTR